MTKQAPRKLRSAEDFIKKHTLARSADVIQLPAAANKPAQPDDGEQRIRFPVTNDKGSPKHVQANTAAVMDANRITVRYNAIAKDISIAIPDHKGTVDNHHEVCFSKALDACHAVGYTVDVSAFRRHLLAIADSHQFNPFADWVTSAPWDGVDRVTAFYDSMQTRCDSKMKRRGMLRFAMTVLAAGFNPEGITGGGITLVLVGAQGGGKSFWSSHLVPKSLELFKDGSVDPDDRDSVSQALSYLLFELGELDGVFRKADVARLKAFLSRDFDRFRRPYASMDSRYARRTAFIATVNHHEFLVDETGNRRYWPLDVISINQLPDDDQWKQQMWAQLYEQHYLKREPWNLSAEEIRVLNHHNQSFTVVSPTEDRMLSKFDFSAPKDQWKVWNTATHICDLANVHPDAKATKAVGAIIRKAWASLPKCDAVGDAPCERRTGAGRLLLTPPLRKFQ